MPTPTKMELLSNIRDGRLDLAIKKLNEATDQYAMTYGLAHIKEGYNALVLVGGRLQELIHMVNKNFINERDASIERSLISDNLINSLDQLPECFWSNEPPPPPKPEEVKPPPIPKVSRPQITETEQPKLADATSSTSNSNQLYTPAQHLPEKIKPVLIKYRPKLYLAELDFAPLDFERSFDFLNKYLPSMSKDLVIAAFTEKYFWKLSGIVLTNNFLYMKDTFGARVMKIDYRSIESVSLEAVFPWSLLVNGESPYALGGYTHEQRELLRSFVEEVVVIMRS
ncbi:MAG: hypothetical protein AAGF87_16555 [Bacteroidota bacterium]